MRALASSVIAIAASCMSMGLLAQGTGRYTPPPTPHGVVVDANGKTVGKFIYLVGSTQARVHALLNGKAVTIPLAARFDSQSQSIPDVTKLVPGGSPLEQLFFAGSNCTGAAYVVYFQTPGMYPSVAIADGLGAGRVYIGTPGDLGSTPVNSYSDAVGNCIPSLRSVSPAFMVTEVVDLSTLFVPPYTVR
jgi:hypothetical protein